MISVTKAQLSLIAPNIRATYREAFANADATLAKYQINTSRLRLVHFMAQVLHESGGLTLLRENMNYRAERIVQVWPKRFANVTAAKPYAHNPEKLANKVYGGRMGNTQPGDGWRFIGRGLLQITGRESYEKYGKRLEVALQDTPDLAAAADWCLAVAAEEWTEGRCNEYADADNLKRITRIINGGYNGLASRADWLAKAKKIW